MNQQVLLSNVTANSTMSSWAQAYSTLNFYVVLSLWKPLAPEQDTSTTLIPLGKDLLDRLQREFFSFDEKSLDNTKLAVENSLAEIEDKAIQYSIALATIKEDTLYIVLASQSKTILRRDGKFGVIAQGEEGQVIGFSGQLEEGDLVILETEDFAKKIPTKELIQMIDNRPVHELSEIIAPALHTESKGSEGAMFIEYKPISQSIQSEESFESPEEKSSPPTSEESGETKNEDAITTAQESDNKAANEQDEEVIEPKIHTYTEQRQSGPILKYLAILKSFKISRKKFLTRKTIGIVVAILLLILVTSAGMEWNNRKNEKRKEELEQITIPAQKKIEEAQTLMDLDVTLALAELTKAKSDLSSSLGSYKEGSDEYKKLSDLLNVTNSLISKIEQGTEISGAKEVISANGDLGKIKITAEFESKIALIGEKGLGEIQSDGKIDKIAEDDTDYFAFAHDARFYYAGNNEKIVRVDKGNKASKTVSDEKRSTISIDVFGGNIYALQKDGGIVRFAVDSFSDSNYFKEEVGKPIEPASFTIDGSVYVLQNNGEVKKYTRGKLDPFGIKGVVTQIGSGGLIDTAEGFSNLYILDRKNKRIVILEKNGNFKTQLQWSELSKASSFAVDEKAQKAYIVIDSSVFAVPLQEQ